MNKPGNNPLDGCGGTPVTDEMINGNWSLAPIPASVLTQNDELGNSKIEGPLGKALKKVFNPVTLTGEKKKQKEPEDQVKKDSKDKKERSRKPRQFNKGGRK